MAKPLRCNPSLFQQDLSGRSYIVTGSNSGIGLVTTQQLVKQGAHVVMACRRVEAAEAAADHVRDGSPSGSIEVMELNLGDLASVRTFAESFLARCDRLDGLVNNAGVMNTGQGTTADGFETQLGINHMGHFLLTSLLLDRLRDTAPSRIVTLSSCYHDIAMGRKGHIHFDDLNFTSGKYDGWKAYAQAKLANLLHSRELGKRLQGTEVTAVSVHPGWVRTELIRNTMPVWAQNLMRPFLAFSGMIEPWDGAQTTLHCLLDEDVPNHTGAFFSQRGMYSKKECNKGGWPMVSPNAEANDDAIAERLWNISAEAVGCPA